MKEKYYVPSTEEFHIGFEFEYMLRGSNQEEGGNMMGTSFDIGWTKRTIVKPYMIPEDHIGYSFRVKYLDKEDIESFWFKLKDESHPEFKNIDNIGPDAMYFTGNLNGKELMLFYSVEINKLEILDKVISNKDYTSYQSLFIGYIKNKSELKVLLKQLRII